MTTSPKLITIGNAIVDVLAKVEDSFLATFSMDKGAMLLVDQDQSTNIYDAMPPAIERSGGSAGNTAAGVAMLGGSVGYIGKVFDDQLGKIFRHDIGAVGVDFPTPAATEGESTANCMVLITPDAQRTMNTYLGACGGLSVDDIDEAYIAGAEIIYVEGYLWDRPDAKEAVLKAFKIAKASKTKVALSLSDSFCVDRFRDEFMQLIEEYVDILFANEDEIKSLYEIEDFSRAASLARGSVEIAALTRGDKGSTIIAEGQTFAIPAEPTSVEDTTGAGDLYAAGFLYGLQQGYGAATCARIGGICAAEVISHVGPRPEVDLKDLIVGLT
ncbi:adenosine kinase [Temperatibacter marinus]|uniref:Adenosine kinase n=1 Tax=Temperatibacter marinus TaxID=1456591 RepID=A0AA52EKE4_9PROT|nr:adenosine kinase [Temperatibacter marinus]WND04114.1 adenosine kinase [Temperatibacter marinus]